MQTSDPEPKPRVGQSIVDDYAHYLGQVPWRGLPKQATLWPELRKLGFRGQVNSVGYWLRQRRHSQPRPPGTLPPRPVLRASPRQVVWFILKASPSGENFLEEVYRTSFEIREDRTVGSGLLPITRERHLPGLLPWIAAAKHTALTAFATRLERDLEAAKAALTLPWSQSHVEG